MTWKLPPRIKIFEALGAIADGRTEFIDEENRKLSLDFARDDKAIRAKVDSSDGSKFYTVKYEEANNKITSNDNASKWQGYTGYPIIAVLMKLGKLSFDEALSQELKGIEWKKINTQFRNDWSKTEEYIFTGKDKEKFERFAQKVLSEIEHLSLQR